MILPLLLFGSGIAVFLMVIIGLYSNHKILYTVLLIIAFLIGEYFTIGIYVLTKIG